MVRTAHPRAVQRNGRLSVVFCSEATGTPRRLARVRRTRLRVPPVVARTNRTPRRTQRGLLAAEQSGESSPCPFQSLSLDFLPGHDLVRCRFVSGKATVQFVPQILPDFWLVTLIHETVPELLDQHHAILDRPRINFT